VAIVREVFGDRDVVARSRRFSAVWGLLPVQALAFQPLALVMLFSPQLLDRLG
jgi:hypothetical protein